MKYSSAVQKKLRLFVPMVLLLTMNGLSAQATKNEVLIKIEKLKARPDFKIQSTEYVDLLIDLSRQDIVKKADSSHILLNQAYEISESFNYNQGLSRVLYNYGLYYSQKGNLEKAFEHNLKSLELANKYNFKGEKIYALNNLAIDLWSQGDNAKALTRYLEALEITKELGDKRMMAIINDNIALIYSDNGDLETALAFHEKSLAISTKSDFKFAYSCTLLNMALIYLEQEKYQLAEKTVDECIAFYEKENALNWMVYSYEVKGSLALTFDNYKEALKWYHKAEKICDKISFTEGYSRTYNGLAEGYLGLGELKTAKEYALKALEITSGMEFLEGIKKSNSLLAKIYHSEGRHDSAYEHQSKYIELYIEHSKEKFQKGLGVLRSEMKFENQKKELIKQNDKAIAKQRLYIYLAIFALIVVSIILISVIRTHRLQKRFTEELLLRETELESSNTTKDKLFSIIAHDLRGPINSFSDLLKMYVNGDVSKEEADQILPQAFHEIDGISSMLNNLLIWGKTQLTGTKNNPINNNINTLVNKNIDLLNPLAQKKSIQIHNHITETIDGFYDKDQINIVIRNLLNNAIKFTNVNGKIEIRAKEQEEFLQVSISDDGVGMDLETQAKLFSKNNFKSTYGTNNEKGTGLGLNLCSDMIKANNGEIWVTSVINEGSTFSFKIPSKRTLKAVG